MVSSLLEANIAILVMAEEKAQALKKLIARRGQLKGQLTKFCTFLEHELDREKMFELKARRQKTEFLWNEFQTVQLEIQLLDESDQSEESDLFDKRFFEAMASADSKMESITIESNQNASISDGLANSPVLNHNPIDIGIKLPDIKLPEFVGNYGQWPSFSESFRSLIDDNVRLSKIQKFFYLKSILKGEALNVICNLNVTESNYEIAWQLLVSRYENKRLIVHSHLKAIFDLSTAKENHSSLRAFLDTFSLNYRALHSLNDSVLHWDTILLFLLSSKLDNSTKRDWEKHTCNDADPTIESFMAFLNHKCQLLQTLESKSQPNKVEAKRFEYKTASHMNINQLNSKNQKCIFCGGTHLIYFCNKFLDLSIKARYEGSRKLNICINCLKPGHIAVNCKSSTCKKCHKKHNTLLHFEKENAINLQVTFYKTQQMLKLQSNQVHRPVRYRLL